MYRTFESVESFCDYLMDVSVDKIETSTSDFYGESFGVSMQLLRNGDVNLAVKANKVLDQIQDVVFPSIGSPEDTAYYYGHRPNVSAVISGQPKSMYRRAISGNQYAAMSPLTIYMSRDMSATYSVTDIINRGISCFAFALAMKRIRPVMLYVLNYGAHPQREGVRYGISIAVDLNNIDTSVAAYMLAGNSFFRRLCFAARRQFADLQVGSLIGTPCDNIETMRRELNIPESDLIIPGCALYTTEDAALSMRNPVEWVKRRLKEQGAIVDGEA